jgi:hypothetical protein
VVAVAVAAAVPAPAKFALLESPNVRSLLRLALLTAMALAIAGDEGTSGAVAAMVTVAASAVAASAVAAAAESTATLSRSWPARLASYTMITRSR